MTVYEKIHGMTRIELARFLKELEYGILIFDFKSAFPDTEQFLEFTEPSGLDMLYEIKALQGWLRLLDMDIES